MKFLTRCLLLSLCFVLLLGGSLVSVHAATDETDTSNIKFVVNATAGNNASPDSYWERYFMNSQVVPLKEDFHVTTNRYDILLDYFNRFAFQYVITTTDNSILFEKGRNYTITISNLKAYYKIWYNNIESYSYNGEPNLLFFEYLKDSGERVSLSNAVERVWNPRTESFDYVIKFTPETNVRRVWIGETFLNDWVDVSKFPTLNAALTANVSAVNTGVNISVQSEEAGLLSGLIEWVKQIFNKIGEIGTAIAELPGKLWSMIENGLKNLFVPDEQYIADFRDRWEDLLSSRFGAVWESGKYVELVFAAIVDPPEQDDIHIPEVCINLPESCSFTFGGWTVDIVPNGFEFLATAVKLIVGIACSTLFINGMIKRYDEVMGVEQ